MNEVKTKICNLENSFKEKITQKKNLRIIFLIIVSVLAIIARVSMLDFMSGDYTDFLKPWMDKIVELGKINSLKYKIGDYNVPYVTILTIFSYIPVSSLLLIKGLSIIFDFICAIYAFKLVYKFINEKETARLISDICYAIVLFLPTVLINSAAWAQSDIIYTTFIIMSLYYLKENKVFISFLLLGISFAFKLQFIFILPLYIVLYFRRNDISILHFLLIPIVNIIMCLPAICMGKSIMDCISIYFTQTSTYTDLTLNYPNLYNAFVNFFNNQSLVLVIFTAVIIGILIFYILSKKLKVENNIIRVGLMFIMIMVYFLPRMHERYGFLAEILSIIYVLIYKKDYYLPVVLEIGALTGYWNYLSYTEFNGIIFNLITIVQFIVVIKFTLDTIKELKNENLLDK